MTRVALVAYYTFYTLMDIRRLVCGRLGETWMFRGGVAATPRTRRGYSVETSRGARSYSRGSPSRKMTGIGISAMVPAPVKTRS